MSQTVRQARIESQPASSVSPANARSTDKLAMRIKGEQRYIERLRAYLEGDHDQLVSAEFVDAVAALGKRRVQIELLTKDEKVALIGHDLRWQQGPDGVLLWAPVSTDRIGRKSTADFEWLFECAGDLLQADSKQEMPAFPEWLSLWASSWAAWAHRYTSLQFDLALRRAEAKKLDNPRAAAGREMARLVANLRVFLLDYLPKSSLADSVALGRGETTAGWLLPHELLNSEFYKRSLMARDDFWSLCCAGAARPKGKTARAPAFNTVGSTRSKDVQGFLDFVSGRLNSEGQCKKFVTPFYPRNSTGTWLLPVSAEAASNSTASAVLGEVRYTLPPARNTDRTCSWISVNYPGLSAWEPFARDYVESTKRNVSQAINGLVLFFDRYLAQAGKPGTPAERLDPECAKRPIADEFGTDALLLRVNRDRVPKTLDSLTANKQKGPMRSIRDGFIEHILKKHCSLVEGDHVTLMPQYWNPFSNIELDDADRSVGNETSRNAMPYRWIRRLRGILVGGAHFCDWHWAQQAQLGSHGNSADWFEVDESIIDRSDPDCVWRQRSTGGGNKYKERTFYEMWSPVRWVTLVAKLCTALRTMQVRVLDSGETDELRFDLREWSRHTYPNWTEADGKSATTSLAPPAGASGTPWVLNDVQNRSPRLHASIVAQEAVRRQGGKDGNGGWANGVLRAQWTQDVDRDRRLLATVLYVNTNKTADSKKEGAAKGFQVALPMYPCPLPPDNAYWFRDESGEVIARRSFASTRQKQAWEDELAENIHWWLAKLRDWQEKYNPIERRMDWRELSGTGLIEEKSDEQYELYRPTCFLFREPSVNKSKSHPGPAYPIPDAVVANAWWQLLKELQDRMNDERDQGEPEVRLVFDDTGGTRRCVYDLHSIRVSIITALIVEGKVPVQYVQALVGHSRIVMTIYYTKINPLTMMREIQTGFSRASEAEVNAEKLHLQNATAQQLRERMAFNDPTSALAALGASRPPGSRNIVMWMRKLGGICPVGGVSHDTEGGLPAGCFNGGPWISGEGPKAKHGPVEGGPGTCVNCRWFVTSMRFIGELHAISENSLYRYYELKDKATTQERKIDEIRGEWEAREISQGTLTNAQKAQFDREMDAAESIRDGFMESAAIDVLISANAYAFIRRLGALEDSHALTTESRLVAAGTPEDVKVVLQQTNSAMLHAARVCLHSEIHPELNASAATLRVAMGVARKLQEEDLDPFALLNLPEELQTRAVNAISRHIAALCDAGDFNVGLGKAMTLLESKRRLSEITATPVVDLAGWLARMGDGQTSLPMPVAATRDALRLAD